MERREGMALSGSASYYLNRGGVSGSGTGSGSRSGPHGGGLPLPPGFELLPSNPNFSIQSNVRVSSIGTTTAFQVEQNPSPNYTHSINTAAAPAVKKKRGRPRKYGPDGTNMSLALSPMSSTASPGSTTSGTPKRSKGRPRGSGRKQQLAALGEWMNNSAGLAFTPHVIHVAAGEDVAAKLFSFAQQRPRALCILSANGTVSAVTLRQPTSSGDTVTYEGRFEILCMSGSYLLAESGGPRNRTGGLSISVCSPDGHVLGGAIGGKLIASSPVQVIACSFVYGGSKPKTKTETDTKPEKKPIILAGDKSSSTPTSAGPSQNPNLGSSVVVWPPTSSSRPDLRDPHTEIDLTRG